MNHPGLDRLTAWVHGCSDADVDAHVPSCSDCRAAADGLREEARILSREIGDPERLAALKAGLLHAAGRRRPLRGLLWQVPIAAAALIGLVFVLLSPGSRHRVVDGRVALEDGKVVAAPVDLAAARTWQLQAVDPVRVELSDRSTVALSPGARLSLAPDGARGVQAELTSGEGAFAVAPDPRRLIVCSPAGRVEAADGRFSMKIVFEEGGTPVKKAFAGALVTVLAGSISLSNANGSVEAQQGQAAVLAAAEAPLFLRSPQDRQEELLRRLEQLAARVAKLEEEVAQLEKRNAQLKTQLSSNAPGGAGGWSFQGNGGARVFSTSPGAVIIEHEGNPLKKQQAEPNKEK
jgi:hypothetical protein